MEKTVNDCNLNGEPLLISELANFSSDKIASVVGFQSPGSALENPDDYNWSFHMITLEELRYSNEDAEEPEGGWRQVYLNHKMSDEKAIASGSPEYEGRQEWLAEWSKNTKKYPLFVVKEADGNYRLLDGYHRLAGAFWHEVKEVAAYVGVAKS